MNIRLVAPILLGLLVGSPATGAATPPPSWTNDRVLECEDGVMLTHLTPARFGTPFHVLSSEDVIIPQHVEVVFPGDDTTYVTIHVPGFEAGPGTVHCWYVDPVGLEVELWGRRT